MPAIYRSDLPYCTRDKTRPECTPSVYHLYTTVVISATIDSCWYQAGFQWIDSCCIQDTYIVLCWSTNRFPISNNYGKRMRGSSCKSKSLRIVIFGFAFATTSAYLTKKAHSSNQIHSRSRQSLSGTYLANVLTFVVQLPFTAISSQIFKLLWR